MARGVRGNRLRAYATLFRVPNLFSAPPDVILGAALVAATGGTISFSTLSGLCVASVLLYAGGVVLNDYFDASVDARERPERPIPSGAISRLQAGVLGAGALVLGVLAAFVADGWRGGEVAAALALVILVYDGRLKGTGRGFVTMGCARGLNVLLGFAAGGFVVADWTVLVSLVVVAYIALVTRMAANEATATERGAVAGAAAGVVLGVVGVLAALVAVRPPLLQVALGVVLAAGFAAWTGRAIGRAYATPKPSTVGPAVGTCVLALVVLDSAFAAIAGVGWTLAALAFLIPAVGLARVFDVS